MRSAVLDLGSNTFHVLVADVDGFGIRSVLHDQKIAVRIGEHAFADRRIPDHTYARGLDALGELLERVDVRTLDRWRIVATGVFREAANGAQFVADARDRYGITVEMLDGCEEARLTWLGVSAELAGSHGRLAVIDLGGGSLECMIGMTGVEHARSLPLGVLRLRDLDAAAVRNTVVATAGHAISELRARAPETVAISSGTARALLRTGRALGTIADMQRHLSRITLGELASTLANLTSDQLGAAGVEPARRDTIATGAAVFDTLVDLLRAPVVYVARSALREGVLIELARRRSRDIESMFAMA